MLSIDIGDVRDLVLVVWGSVSILLTLILLVIVAVILYFGRKGMSAVHHQVETRGVKLLDRANAIAVKVRDRTAAFPGAPGSEAGATALVSAVSDLKELKDIDPPFRRKVKSWRPF